ncbi:MAG TPA: sensor histidine kinase [Solirubrobacterales bacterium]|nr:sensor histidine kinase [Solirubrobacterales bacterium]
MDSDLPSKRTGDHDTRMKADFRHDALIYSGEEEFLAGVVPYLQAGVEAGEVALVAVELARMELLQAEFRDDFASVFFADIEDLGRNPARIIPFWREFVDEHAGSRVRGVGEPLGPGRDAREIDECQRHEALMNVAFGPNSTWSLLCAYDAGALSEEALARVADSHQHVTCNGVVEQGLGFLAADQSFAGALSSAPAEAEASQFDIAGLAGVRRRVEAIARHAGLASLHISDLAVAANELATNSVAHGGGHGTLRTWQEPDRVVVEVEDRGRIRDPLVGRIRPLVTQEGGRGLWLANQLCDLVQIRSGDAGTTVRLHMATV